MLKSHGEIRRHAREKEPSFRQRMHHGSKLGSVIKNDTICSGKSRQLPHYSKTTTLPGRTTQMGGTGFAQASCGSFQSDRVGRIGAIAGHAVFVHVEARDFLFC